MLVSWDYEERGLVGSSFFVKDYLLPKIKQSEYELMGSMSLETNLNYNDENDTQTLPPGAERINAEAYAKMKENGFKSDFYMMMARPEDASLANEIAKHMLKEGRDVCFNG